jgi:SAM-dependent methyltransferase
MQEWWQSFFDEHFLEYGFSVKTRKVTLRDVRFIEKLLGLRKGARILDVCCGVGRHSIELASRGYRVTGIDAMQPYVDVAASRAGRRKVRASFEACDMRRLRYRNEFDAAICMWTSFGYFEDDKDHLKGLRAIRRALRRRGKFIVDLINRDWLIKNFQPYGWFERTGGFVLEHREFDPAGSRIDSEWVYIKKNGGDGPGVVRKTVSLRVYSPHELLSLLEAGGFTVGAVFGDRQEVMPTPDHRMLSVLAYKRD